jgi:hypothetical protein
MTTAIVAPSSPRIIAVGKVADGSIELRTGPTREYQDAYTLGRSRFVAGGMLEDCATPAERAGFVGAESDARKADLRAGLAVDFDEWRHNHDAIGGDEWEL